MNFNKAILLVVFTILLILTWNVGLKVGGLSKTIYKAQPNDANLVQWKKDWRNAADSIVFASVIAEDAEELYLYVDYIYSGKNGIEATICGTVKGVEKQGLWGCAPAGIKRGRGFVSLRLTLNDKARDIECSTEVGFKIYDNSGKIFYEESYFFEKVWVKNGSGVSGKIREIFSKC
jgi:hypothetical protein